MTFPPENETPPVFDREQFHMKHISTMDIVDNVAADLGLELPETEPRPALIKTNRPVIEEDTAQIKRELWENPNIAEQLDTTIERPDSEPEDPEPVPEKEPETPDIPSPNDDSTPLVEKRKPIKTEVPEDKAKTSPPLQIKKILKPTATEPFTLEGEKDASPKREINGIHIIAASILLILFVTIDCYCALHTVPSAMIFVRLLIFALGFAHAAAMAWRASGIKLIALIVLLMLFLFHFNYNGPVLSIVEKFYTPHPAMEKLETEN